LETLSVDQLQALLQSVVTLKALLPAILDVHLRHRVSFFCLNYLDYVIVVIS